MPGCLAQTSLRTASSHRWAEVAAELWGLPHGEVSAAAISHAIACACVQLRWAPLLYGNLLASGHDSGVICLHEEANIGGEVWKTAAKCNGSNRAAIEVLEFAPPEQGLCLASASSSHMRCVAAHTHMCRSPHTHVSKCSVSSLAAGDHREPHLRVVAGYMGAQMLLAGALPRNSTRPAP